MYTPSHKDFPYEKDVPIILYNLTVFNLNFATHIDNKKIYCYTPFRRHKC